MKRTIFFLAVLLISFSYHQSFTEEPRKAFQRLIEYAHPTPEILDKLNIPMLPLSKSENTIFFYNYPTTIEELGTFQMQNESSIAINPLNPNVLMASAVDYRDTSSTWVYFSLDGGRTWKNKNLKRPFPGWRSSNDPSVAFSYDGIGYVVYGGFGVTSDTSILFGENGVFISRTTDNGSTWTAHIPIIVHRGPQTIDSSFEDKYYITVDNSPNSPYRGRIYVPWKRVLPRDSSTQIVLSFSSDKGDSWSKPIEISPKKSGTSEDTTFGQSFPLASIGPNGEVYVVWNDGTESSIGFSKSTDGGITFSQPKHIIKYNPFGKTKYLRNQGYRHTVKGSVRAEAYPSLVCDYTGGPRSGYLYLCWSADSIPNVYFARSTDGGTTWSKPVIVHSDTTNDQFWPWIALDPKRGDIAIMYLDSRNDPNNLMVECYVSYSSDGGETWIDQKVSDISSDLRLNPFSENSFAGDYSGCAFYDGKIYPSWVDMRNSVQNIYDSDVYTSYISINTPKPPENFIAKILPEEPDKILLQWETPKTTVFNASLDTINTFYILKRFDRTIDILNYSTTQFLDSGLTPHKLQSYSISTFSKNDTSIERRVQAYPGGAKNPMPPTILSAYSKSGTEVSLIVKIPALREDSTTPLVNLHSLILYDDTTRLAEFPLSSNDTNKIIELTLEIPNFGFYNFLMKIQDKLGNESNLSKPLLKYIGPIPDISQTPMSFDFNINDKKKFLRINGWDYITNLFHSEPSSITDSPFNNYPARKEIVLRLFPFKLVQSNSIIISFWHIALIHRTDTGYVQVIDGKDNLVTIGKYNITSHQYVWDDKILDQNDWINEILYLDKSILGNLNTEELYLQFSLVSGPLGTNDGWYLDDIWISDVNLEVQTNFDKKIPIFPNPGSNFLIVNYPSKPILEVSISNLLGTRIELPTNSILQENEKLIIQTGSLPNGIYLLHLKESNGEVHNSMFVIFR